MQHRTTLARHAQGEKTAVRYLIVGCAVGDLVQRTASITAPRHKRLSLKAIWYVRQVPYGTRDGAIAEYSVPGMPHREKQREEL